MPKISEGIDYESFETWLKAKKLQPNTIQQYLRALKRYQRSYGEELTVDAVSKFIARSNSTVERATIKALKEMHPDELQHIHLPRTRNKPRKLPRMLTGNDVEVLLSGIPQDYALLVWLMIECGLRIQEAISLQRNQIERDRNRILIKGKGGKERFVYPGTMLISALLEQLNSHTSAYVWPSKKGRGKHLHSNTIRHHMKKVVPKSHPHKCRHYFATTIYEATGEDLRVVQELLGHANISTTAIYSHVSSKRAREAAKNAQKYSV